MQTVRCIMGWKNKYTHPLQLLPLLSQSLRQSARLTPYLLSWLQGLLELHLQERPVRHSYCCPSLGDTRSNAVSTAAKIFIVKIYGTRMEIFVLQFTLVNRACQPKSRWPIWWANTARHGWRFATATEESSLTDEGWTSRYKQE